MSERYDVTVVGGGTAGVAAAVSAARRGARVLLVERGPTLGGNAAHALVHTICGLYLPAHDGTDEPIEAHAGFPRRFARGLRAAGGAGEPERAGRVFVLPTFPDVLARYAAEVCRAEPSLTTAVHTAVIGAHLATDARGASVVETRDGSAAKSVESRIVVDTSGDGAVAALGGAATTMAPADELQCPSFIFRLAGVDPGTAVGFGRLQVSVAAAGAARSGVLARAAESVLLRPGAAPDEVYVTLNVARPPAFDPLDEVAVAALTASAQSAAESLIRFLRDTRPAFRHARILAWPRRIGIRETRRLAGLATVTADDVVAGRRVPDEVAVSTWPIEMWRDHRRAELTHPAGPSSVPLGALVSRSHPRLGMAGRCCSATHEALGALRVIGTALATGEAIGVAAAIAADTDGVLGAVDPAVVRARIAAASEA